jgi:hypothetical protein
MSTETACIIAIAAWVGAFGLFSSFMRKKEVERYYQLQVSKASHPAGKMLKR